MLKNNPLVYLVRKTWEYSKGNRRNLILYFAMFVVANAIDLLEPLVFAKIMNIIQEIITKQQAVNGDNLVRLALLLLLFPAITLAFWVFHGPARVIERANGFRVEANYKNFLLAGIMVLPIEWHVEHHSGDTSDKVERGSSALFSFSEQSFEVIEMIVRLVGSYAALVYFHLPSTYIVSFMVLVAGSIVIKYDKILVPQYRQINKAENKIAEKIIDAITNITTIIILRVEKHVCRAISGKIIAPFSLFRDSCKVNEIKWFFVNVCSSVSLVLVLFSYFWGSYKSKSEIMLGTIYALYGYISRINSLFFNFASKYSQIVRQRTSVANAEEIANDFRSREGVDKVSLGPAWKRLEIESLSFSYHTEEGADLHLDNVSLAINRGQKIALIGETGSGKTTLLKVIRELYHPRMLELYLDDRPVRDGFRAISSEISLIPQDPEIFATTIRENIVLGADYDMGIVMKFTDIACFTDVIARLPHGFDSLIHEKGVNLSGGERQRLALARGLLASNDKAIVLLDEPTSSVDPVNEQKIYSNIFSAFGDKAIICSLHSLHLLPMFDYICLFDDGEIVASGTFDELLESSDEFKKLWEDFIRSKDRSSNGNQ